MPIFEQIIGVLTQELKILFFPEPFPQFLSFGVEEAGVHFTWDVPFDFVGVAEVSPLVQEIDGDDVIERMVGLVELLLVLLDLFLELLEQFFVEFILFGSYFFGGSAAGCSGGIKLNVHM